MLVAVGVDLEGEVLFELAPAVVLDQSHMPPEAPRHGLRQERAAVGGGERGCHEDIRALPHLNLDRVFTYSARRIVRKTLSASAALSSVGHLSVVVLDPS